MKPYMPICQLEMEAVSALIACQSPCLTLSARIGLIVKYWNATPSPKATMKSNTHTAYIFC